MSQEFDTDWKPLTLGDVPAPTTLVWPQLAPLAWAEAAPTQSGSLEYACFGWQPLTVEHFPAPAALAWPAFPAHDEADEADEDVEPPDADED